MEGFVQAARVDELGSGDLKLLEVGDEKIALANVDGQYYAFGDVCTHMECSLSDGTIEGDAVECPCHGSQFNMKTSAVEEGPADEPVPLYSVRVEGDNILVGPA